MRRLSQKLQNPPSLASRWEPSNLAGLSGPRWRGTNGGRLRLSGGELCPETSPNPPEAKRSSSTSFQSFSSRHMECPEISTPLEIGLRLSWLPLLILVSSCTVGTMPLWKAAQKDTMTCSGLPTTSGVAAMLLLARSAIASISTPHSIFGQTVRLCQDRLLPLNQLLHSATTNLDTTLS